MFLSTSYDPIFASFPIGAVPSSRPRSQSCIFPMGQITNMGIAHLHPRSRSESFSQSPELFSFEDGAWPEGTDEGDWEEQDRSNPFMNFSESLELEYQNNGSLHYPISNNDNDDDDDEDGPKKKARKRKTSMTENRRKEFLDRNRIGKFFSTLNQRIK